MQGILRPNTIILSGILDAPAERIIAKGRFVLCLISLLSVHLYPIEPAQYSAAVILALTVYTVLSAGLVALTYRRFLSPSIQRLIHFADFTIISLLLFLTEGLTSPPLVLSTFVLSTFVLLAATFRRWKWQEVAATAVAFGLVLLGASTIREVITKSSPAGSDLTIAITFGVYLIVVGALLAYVSASNDRSRRQFERLAQPVPNKTASPIEQILAHAALVLEAPRILVVWEEAEEPYVYWSYLRNGHYQESREFVGTFGNLVDPSLRNISFLMDNARLEFLWESNGPRRIQSPAIDTDLVAKFSICSVTTAAFAGTICTGRVFALDCGDPTDNLVLAKLISCRIGMRLDRLALQRQTEAAIVAREKMRLIQDLHDGVLQSLSAATLQLSLVDKTPDPASRLALVTQLLAKEQRRIRKFVEETHIKSTSLQGAVVNGDLRQVVQDSGHYWNCTTSFSLAPDNATIPEPIVDQLSFMLTEAVANAARHGGASNIEVAMERADGHLDINIRDNGRGFAPPVEHKHVDQPASIRERVRALGGSINVTSFPDGAELAIRVPLP
jgi:signal transduction histidine kinase